MKRGRERGREGEGTDQDDREDDLEDVRASCSEKKAEER